MSRFLAVLLFLSGFLAAQSTEPAPKYKVKYVTGTSVYLDGGRSAGLSPGMRLSIRRSGSGAAELAVAELEVTSVASASAVCEVKTKEGEIEVGDTATLSLRDVQMLQALKAAQAGSKYVQVIAFTDGDPLDEEARSTVPHAPSPAVNRARGRIGFEYNSIRQHDGGGASSQFGLVLRADMTRLGGACWSLSGYWRGRLNSRDNARQETITDLLNRTYHLSLSCANGNGWSVGFGRFYLPWASSLETIDGGYVAKRIARRFTVGSFAGSTPDPTAWNYNPNRQLFGTFVNYSSGSFENLHISSTGGAAVSRIHWKPERQFAFFENGIFYKRYLSIYHNLETDRVKDVPGGAAHAQISRSFLTVRIQPLRFLSFDVSHNHFRNVPTFDPRLLATGLLDHLLFQGVSAGVRVELPARSSVYASLGRNSRTGDSRVSLNQMYGLAKADVLHTGLRADLRYSKFDSPFGRGDYRAVSLSREVGQALRFEIQAGDQTYASAMTSISRARFINATGDAFLATHYFLGGGYSIYRSQAQNYDQLYITLGYRF